MYITTANSITESVAASTNDHPLLKAREIRFPARGNGGGKSKDLFMQHGSPPSEVSRESQTSAFAATDCSFLR